MDASSLILAQMVLIGVVLMLHTYIGIVVIRRNLIFSDLALDQLAALGAGAGLAMGVEYGSPGSYLSSLVLVLAGSAALAVIGSSGKTTKFPKDAVDQSAPDFRADHAGLPREATIGCIYCMALVFTLLVTDKIPRGCDFVSKSMTGQMLWVSWDLVGVTCLIYVLLGLVHYRYREKFVSLLEERDFPGRFAWEFIFFMTQGIITVLIVPIAGVMLAYGFLMIPAACGLLLGGNFKEVLLKGWLSGMAASVGGIFAAYSFDLPYGPTLLIFMGFCFAVLLGGHVIGSAGRVGMEIES